MINLDALETHEPLAEYSWVSDIDKIFKWLSDKSPEMNAFIFDVAMSLAYIDATSGLQKYLEFCPSIKAPYRFHLGFINLCAPCYVNSKKWVYQKAAKPQSGTIGKISSELILRYFKVATSRFISVKAVGGTEFADAVLETTKGEKIFAEVKSAPLITYPLIFSYPKGVYTEHQKISISESQLRQCDTALYMHENGVIPLGKNGSENWPFANAASYITDPINFASMESMCKQWICSKEAYANRDRASDVYYLTNACGRPPVEARDQFEWPPSESISDGKTSAGMDRTDDIKKGIYQTIKLGTLLRSNANWKTALISNLPAIRHGNEYVTPFVDLLWGYSSDITRIDTFRGIKESDLRFAFDYIITIIDPLDR
jgi:hypothetical protein